MEKNEKLLFDNPNTISNKNNEACTELIRNNRFDELKKTSDIDDYRKKFIINMIDLFTSDDDFEDFANLASALFKVLPDYFLYVDIKYSEEYYNYVLKIKTIDDEYEILKLTDIFPRSKYFFLANNISLEDNSRKHKCQLGSHIICQLLDYLGIESNIIATYIYGFKKDIKYLHSFVEFQFKGEPFVIDSTLNAVINKKTYYKLFDVNENDIIQTISTKDLNDDQELIEMINLAGISYNEYDVFRDEIINDLSKNKHIL